MGPKKGQGGKATKSKNSLPVVPDSDHIVFGTSGTNDPRKESKPNNEATQRADSRKLIAGASWTGKLPVNLLSEHCQKQKWNKPEYSMRQEPGTGEDDRKYKSAVTLSKSDPKTGEKTTIPPFMLPKDHASLASQPSALEARHFAATYALFRVSSMKNIHMTLPPQYRDLWKGVFEQLKKEDVKEGRGWKYEADPFSAESKRKDIQASIEHRKQEAAKKEQANTQSNDAMPVLHGLAKKQWESAPRIDLGSAVRLQMETLIRTRSTSNPSQGKMSKEEIQRNILELLQLGFRRSHVEEAFENCGTTNEALEWLLIHVPEDDLPTWSLPQTYSAGISLASGNPARDAKVKRLARAGYASHLCSQALRDNDEDETAAAATLQASLISSKDVNESEKEVLSSTSDVWKEEMTAMKAIFDERMSSTNPGQCSIICSLDHKTPVTIHFENPRKGYPDRTVPILAVESQALPAYIRLQAIKQAVYYAQQHLLGDQMLYSLVEWFETNLPMILENPGKLKEIDINVSSFRASHDQEEPKIKRKILIRGTNRENKALKDFRSNDAILRDWKSRQDHPEQIKMNAQRRSLPAANKALDVVEALHNRQVTIITGETGSGKSTQAVQFILDDAINKTRGSSTNIVCTQPRRVAALSLCDRVSSERCTAEGNEVGYIIRGDSKLSSKTKITFMTTGVLLRRLQSHSNLSSALSGISHVFVDEVHERSVDTDFLLALLQRALKELPKLRLVLMSATADADIFTTYFGGSQSVARVHIEGRTFPVQDFYLEDVLQLVNLDTVKYRAAEDDEYEIDIGKSVQAMGKGTNYELIASLVEHINLELGSEEGGILIFLSGTLEIDRCLRAIQQIPNIYALPLHASLLPAEQKLVFSKPPRGKRKVIVATNVAETSITIDDIVVVIDSGRVKETSYDTSSSMVRLQEVWASRAACKQRRGRAGRVQAGKCYKLFTKNIESSMSPTTLPEIQRIPLEQLCLSVKSMVPQGDVAEFLASTLTPPENRVVSNALHLLNRMGALEGEELTGLGMYLASIPTDLRCAKLLVYGIQFGCFEACLTMTSILTVKSPFFSPRDDREEARKARASFSTNLSNGDLILDYQAFEQWKIQSFELRPNELRRWCSQNFLSLPILREIDSTRQQLLTSLKEAYLIPHSYRSPNSISTNKNSTESNNTIQKLNKNNNSTILLRSLIAGSLNPQIAEIRFPDKKYISSMTGTRELDPEAKTIKYYTYNNTDTENMTQMTNSTIKKVDNEERSFIHPSSILFEIQSYQPSSVQYISYFNKFGSGLPIKPYLRDLTPLNPYGLLLFCGSMTIDPINSPGLLIVDEKFKLKGWTRIGILVSKLRKILDEELKRKFDLSGIIQHSSSDDNDDDDDTEFNQVLDLVKRLVEFDGLDQ